MNFCSSGHEIVTDAVVLCCNLHERDFFKFLAHAHSRDSVRYKLHTQKIIISEIRFCSTVDQKSDRFNNLIDHNIHE